MNRLGRMPQRQKTFWSVVMISCIVSLIWVNHNYGFYERPIAKIVETELTNERDVSDHHGNSDRIHTQALVAEVKNGEHQGTRIQLHNDYSNAKAYDYKYDIGDDVFIFFSKHQTEGELRASIVDVKRDHHVMIAAWLFIFALLLVGKRQGLFSIIGLAVNATLLSIALDIQMNAINISLLWITGICAVLFTAVSLLLVNGFNEKTYAAMITTFLGTTVSLGIAFIVLHYTGDEGLRYEEMQYLTRAYKLIFFAGLFIGSLGAVMDIGITMSASMFSLYEEDEHITDAALKQSGMAIGKDVMAVMTNILFFAYISGSIPALILYLKNGSPLGFTLSMNLSLELARALIGGIGIVLSIPIAMYTSLYFVNRKRAKV